MLVKLCKYLFPKITKTAVVSGTQVMHFEKGLNVYLHERAWSTEKIMGIKPYTAYSPVNQKQI